MTSIFNSTAKLAIVAAMGAATLLTAAAPASAQPYDERTNGVTSCAATGGRQEVGAVVGAVLGAVVGRQFSRGEPTAGAVGGAVVGSAIGAGVGCQSQHERERRQATNGYDRDGGYASYDNGRYDDGRYDNRGYDNGRYNDGRYNDGRNGYVAPARYERMNQWMVADTRVALRQAPTSQSPRIGSLRGGERFQAIGRVRGSDWIMVADRGQFVGYVRGDAVSPIGRSNYAYGYNR